MTDLPMRTALTAHSVAALVPVMWGLYWIPARYVESATGAGVWGTVCAVLVACIALAPFAWHHRGSIREASLPALVSTGLGGTSFAFYAAGLLYGDVVVVVVLYYLTPVWSVLIARLWYRQTTSLISYAVILIGLAGVILVLKGDASGLPIPREIGDWLGLAGGLLWSVASTGIYRHSRLGSVSSNFVFSVGALVSALLLAVTLGGSSVNVDASVDYATGVAAILLIGLGWWAVALTGFLWAARFLEPTRLGIFMMTEVAAGAVSAALLAGEPFGPVMSLGAGLVILAGVIAALSPSTPRFPGSE